MQYNFRAFGVWSYVLDILKCPSTATQSSYASASGSPSHTTSVVTQDQWVYTDEQIMAYIMRSVSILICLSIGSSTSSREQWLALSHMFIQIDLAREYQLCQALQEAKQEDRLIQDFYSLLFGYQEELQTMNVLFSNFMFVFTLEFQKQRDRRNLFHFAMRLHPEFETLHSSILHRHPLPSLTEAVAEFTSEKIRL